MRIYIHILPPSTGQIQSEDPRQSCVYCCSLVCGISFRGTNDDTASGVAANTRMARMAPMTPMTPMYSSALSDRVTEGSAGREHTQEGDERWTKQLPRATPEAESPRVHESERPRVRGILYKKFSLAGVELRSMAISYRRLCQFMHVCLAIIVNAV